MKKHLSANPYFIALLPVFYIVNLINEYYPVLTVHDLLLPVSMWFIGIAVLLYLIFRFISPALIRYTIALFFLEIVYLFFSPLLTFLKHYLSLVAHYIILLPIILCLALLLVIVARKRDALPRKLFLYLNTLLLLLVLLEITKSIAVTASAGQSKNWLTKHEEKDISGHICDTCSKPDIYFIIFDGYSGPGPLEQYWHYDNSQLDSFFVSKGFHYASRSNSNYNSTPFSMASILNMEYLRQNPGAKIDVVQFCKAIQTVSTSKVCRMLQANNYTIKNISWLPLPGERPILNIDHLVNKKKLILAQTFSQSLLNDIGWRWGYGKKYTPDEIRKQTALGKKGIEQGKQTYLELLSTSSAKNKGPVFVYTHFLLPHDPYFYDSTGKQLPESTWFQPTFYDERYLSQLKYTNSVIKDIVTHLRTEGDRPRIIIIQGDHGYRSFKGISSAPNDWEFKNLNAIYFPDQEYAGLNDSLSSVNTFRMVFNKYLNTNMPLLKDSTVFFSH